VVAYLEIASMLPIVKKVKNIGNSGHMPKYDSQKVPLPPSTLFIWPHESSQNGISMGSTVLTHSCSWSTDTETDREKKEEGRGERNRGESA